MATAAVGSDAPVPVSGSPYDDDDMGYAGGDMTWLVQHADQPAPDHETAAAAAAAPIPLRRPTSPPPRFGVPHESRSEKSKSHRLFEVLMHVLPDGPAFESAHGGVAATWLRDALPSGRCLLDGVPCFKTSRIVTGSPTLTIGLRACVGDAVLSRHPRAVTVMLHKPAGCVTAVTDAQHATVMEWLRRWPGYEPHLHHNVHPVGRLDKDTTGLLIFTNDGMLHQRCPPTRPSLSVLGKGMCVWLASCVEGNENHVVR